MKPLSIANKGDRAKLEPRREPYWRKIAQGRYLGFRKLDIGGTWIARYTESREHTYRALDGIGPDDYDAADVAARAFFADIERGVTGRTHEGKHATVAEACRTYVADRRKLKGDACAHDAEMRFRRTVYEHRIGAARLDRIRSRALNDWRDGLTAAGLSKASANRTLIALKAALNLAVRDRLVTADRIIEWRDVKPYAGASKRRDLFLDIEQRRALRARTDGALRDLAESVMLTGCRAGELTGARRSQFDERTKTLKVAGKTGARSIPLSAQAVTLFTRLSKDKLPAAYLLTRDDGKPWAHSDWDELVREAAKAAELPEGVCLYTLRHSFITQALLDGMTTLEVARIVGTSLQMLEKHYGHLVAATAQDRLAKVSLL